jgi:hypothetical protein
MILQFTRLFQLPAMQPRVDIMTHRAEYQICCVSLTQEWCQGRPLRRGLDDSAVIGCETEVVAEIDNAKIPECLIGVRSR